MKLIKIGFQVLLLTLALSAFNTVSAQEEVQYTEEEMAMMEAACAESTAYAPIAGIGAALLLAPTAVVVMRRRRNRK